MALECWLDLTPICSDLFKLLHVNVAVVVPVEYLERIPEVWLLIRLAGLIFHHPKKFIKIKIRYFSWEIKPTFRDWLNLKSLVLYVQKCSLIIHPPPLQKCLYAPTIEQTNPVFEPWFKTGFVCIKWNKKLLHTILISTDIQKTWICHCRETARA